MQTPAILAHEYSSLDGRFKIRFPDVPQEKEESFETKFGQAISRNLICFSDVAYLLGATDYPMPSVKPSDAKAMFDSARESGLARVAHQDPRLLAESDTSVDGYPARMIWVELKDKTLLHNKCVLVGNRLYLLSVVAANDPNNQSQQAANNFFDSFKIIPALEADLNASWKEFASADGKFKVSFPGTPYHLSAPLPPAAEKLTIETTAYQSSCGFAVMSLDYPQSDLDPAELKRSFDDLSKGELEGLSASLDRKLTSVTETDITFAGYPGRFLVAEFSGNKIYRRKILLVHQRLYNVSAAAPRDDPENDTKKVYETLSMKFINSFSLSEPASS